ncbi:glycerolphosphate mutase [Leishmania donovani]|uniref:Glycerolphosphate_mutase_putative/GeneDB:LmjF.33. 2100 n=1 Tax=Leishmania donovani TaxID=5661 RepID=A0A504Y5H2_LEIDO|nr:Histidine phosphatase (branch 1) family protein [Leishmania donovani]CAJ1992208.1 glycerolphosphate mutase [Leishmania donovani]VDZ48043.1 glycerolphosphate_mutase_putative/GeneDB:LmjF.33.2100 [Leishmania donovani]
MWWTAARRRLYYPNQIFISKDNRRIKNSWLPRRLLLVRHGESEANVNREVYSNTPDWKIPLTALGREQAYDCGKRLRNIIQGEKLYIYYSPYARTRQTLSEIRRSFDESQIQGEREDERLREQEMGNYQPLQDMDATWAARHAFGRLYYRFPFGESGADVGDRVSGFFDSLLRESIGLTVPNMNECVVQGSREGLGGLDLGLWSTGVDNVPGSSCGCSASSSQGGPAASSTGSESAPPSWTPSPHHATTSSTGLRRTIRRTSPHHPLPLSGLGEVEARGVLPLNDHGASAGEDQNVLIIAHGLLIRLFIGRWFRVPMEVFETMCNPPNCAIIVLERDDRLGRLVMTDISKSLFGSDPLLQMMRFDGHEDTRWYREKFLGIVDPTKAAEEAVAEDDDENHYSMSNAHNSGVGAPAPPPRQRKPSTSAATRSSPSTSAPASGTSTSSAESADASASTAGHAALAARDRTTQSKCPHPCMDCTPNRDYMKFCRDADDTPKMGSVD